MRLIDSTYFTAGARHIFNTTLGTDMRTDEDIFVDAYIDDLQEVFLPLAVGTKWAEELTAYLSELDEDGDPARVESYDNALDRLRQAFADYVFFHILRESNDQATITGVKKLSDSNQYVSPINRQVGTWNRMVKRMESFAEWTASDDCPLIGVETDAELTTPINRLNL
ncbi:MAG: hypothetical protein LIO91_08090 [Bacteroidales bacterium]|nr:hypothetical protein [Bacteroidales bacterium]